MLLECEHEKHFYLLFKGISYQQNTFKPSDAKIRRIQTPTQFSGNHAITQGNQSKMRPDSHGECFSFIIIILLHFALFKMIISILAPPINCSMRVVVVLIVKFLII